MRDRDLFSATWRAIVHYGIRIDDLPDPTLVAESDIEDVPDDATDE
jgi:hypothetical protein